MAQCIDSSEAGRWSQPMAVKSSQVFQRYARRRVSICDCVTVLGCELIAGTRVSGLAAVAPVGLACERQTFLLRETSLSGDEQGETSAIRRLRSDGQFSLCLSPGCAGYHAAKSMRGIKRNGVLKKLLWYARSTWARASTPPEPESKHLLL